MGFLKKSQLYAPTRYRVYYLEFLFNYYLSVFIYIYLIKKLVYNQLEIRNQKLDAVIL
jgi:hypothetical protein